MATSSRLRLMEAADDLFYREGFHAVGLDRILNAVGVTKTTFYNHFESKEQLILEVLRNHDRWWRETFQRNLRRHGGDDPRDQLLALPDVIDELINSEEFNGCIFINIAVQFPLPHDPAHEAAADHKREMELIMRDLAMRAGAGDPVGLAEELCLTLEGAYVTQQVARRPQTVNILRRLVQSIVDRYVPLPISPPTSASQPE